jgi:hypothetical protein
MEEMKIFDFDTKNEELWASYIVIFESQYCPSPNLPTKFPSAAA